MMTNKPPRRHLRRLLPLALIAALLAGCSDDESNPTAPGDGDAAEWFAFAASHDTYVDEADGSQNHGQDSLLRLGSQMAAFLQFDLQALPADAVITGMRLRLVQSADESSAGPASVRVAWLSSDAWDENEVTADEAPGPGAGVLGDISLDALASGHRELVFSTQDAVEKAHQEQLYFNRILGVMLTSNQRVDFLSAESTDADARPSLELTYVDGTRVVITALEDAYTHTLDADGNFDGADYVLVDRSYAHTFLKFDLSTLPDGARLEMVRFTMTAHDGWAYGGDGNVYTYLVADDSWTSTGITFDNAPPVVGDALGHWWIWYGGTVVDKVGVNNSLLLRPAVQAEAEGDSVLSLRLNSPGYRTEYYRITDPEAGRRPRLELVYTR